VNSPTHLPLHLAGHEPTGLAPNETIAQFGIGDFRNFVYLILDWKTKSAAWVDPQEDLSEPLKALDEHGFKLSFVLLTHTHHDHISGVPGLLKKFPTLPIHTHEKDARRLSKEIKKNFVPVVEGQTLNLGSLPIHVMHTPGHSAGECSYYLETDRPYLFTGDTIFIRDCGRTDFEDGSNQEMFESIKRIKALSPKTVILPGHHYVKECATTIEAELVASPPFRCQSVEELASLP
jgi:hydroxyacylglutathione hydrolase